MYIAIVLGSSLASSRTNSWQVDHSELILGQKACFRAHSPATHHNCTNTSVKHASHHHTCSWWIWKHEDYSVWNATNWLTWVSAPWFLSLASKLGGIPMCLLFNNTLCFLFCCWSCTTLLYHPSSIGSCCDRRVAAMSIRGNDAGSRIANTNVLFP